VHIHRGDCQSPRLGEWETGGAAWVVLRCSCRIVVQLWSVFSVKLFAAEKQSRGLRLAFAAPVSRLSSLVSVAHSRLESRP